MSAGVRHVVCCTATPPDHTHKGMSIPTSVPTDYTVLQGISCEAIFGRLQILNHFSSCILSSWRLFNYHSSLHDESSVFHINPLSDGRVRSLISPSLVEGLMGSVLSRTMNTKSHGPSVIVHRIHKE